MFGVILYYYLLFIKLDLNDCNVRKDEKNDEYYKKKHIAVNMYNDDN